MYQNYAANNFGNTPYPLPGGPSQSSRNSFYTPPNSSTLENNSRGNVTAHCDESVALSLLQHLEKDELQHLHDNDSKLQDLINDLPQIRGIQQDRENLIATNKSLAEYNLSLQPKLEDLKQIVAEDYEKINALKTTLAEDKARLDGFVGRTSLDTLLALLQTEAAKSEEESEDLATNFFDDGMGMEEFLNQYLPLRTKTHLRRIKSERMAELIRENQFSQYGSGNSGSMSSSQSTQPPTAAMDRTPPYPGSHSTTGGIPYPSSSFGMPHPSLPSYHH